MTNRPGARLSLLEDQAKELDIGVFAKQVRYAQSIKNYDREKYDDIFNDAIEAVRENRLSASKSLQEAATEINKIVKAYQ